MPQAEVSQDPADPALFHISGSRVSGAVKAHISFRTYTVYTHGYRMQQPVEMPCVVTWVENLTINKVPYRGEQVRDIAANLYRDGHLYRKGYTGDATSTAYDVFRSVASTVTALYGTPENISEARITEASQALQEASQALQRAQAAYDAALDAYDDLTQ